MNKISRNLILVSSTASRFRAISTVTKPNIFRRVYDRVSGKTAEDDQKSDIEMLEEFTKLTKCLGEIPIPVDHPMNDLAARIKAQSYVEKPTNEIKDVVNAFKICKSFVDAENAPYSLSLKCHKPILPDGVEVAADNQEIEWQTSMRLRLLSHYMQYLTLAVNEGDIVFTDFNSSSMTRIVDSILRGTPSERIEEHMKLYSPNFNNQQLQDCFYTLCNAEVDCVSTIFLEMKNKHKQHKKGMTKYSKNFLLDTLELNTKSRCVFAWSDPLFTGFKPLPDEHVIPLVDLLKSRRKYFKEGTVVGHTLMSTYLGERRMHYADKLDTRDTLRMGFVFFIGTCILDYIVCTM